MTPTTGIEHHPSEALPAWLDSAHTSIHLVWPCEGREVGAIATALVRGVRVTYVISSTLECEPETAAKLADLVGSHPEAFELFLARQGGLTHAPTTVAIDPNREESALVAVAVAAGETTQAGGASHLGPCVLVRGDAEFASSVGSHVTALTESESTVHLDSPDRVAEMLGDRIFYFAYGSNMNFDQLRRRAPGAEPIAVGFLPDHELSFNRRGTYRPGGVAGLLAKPRARTYGVVYSITAHDLAELDRYEDPAAYRRVTRTIVGTDGIRHRCQVYESVPEGDYAPDPEYLSTLIAGARAAGLPPGYIARLESHRA